MRRFTILSALSVLLFTGCYKDLSTEATTTLNDIVIAGLQDELFVLFGETISLKAKVWEDGREDSDFSYLWEIDLVPNNSHYDRLELGTDLSLEYKVGNTPSTVPYNLIFTVTDKVSGRRAFKLIKVNVSSSLGEGLLVAYTRDGGVTSEFDLLSNSFVTYGYQESTPRYARELYQTANGEKFEGKVNAMISRLCTSGAVYSESWITVGTDEHIINIDPLTFERAKQDAELFNMGSAPSYRTTALYNGCGYQTAAVIGGEVYTCVTHTSNMFSKNYYGGSPADIFGPENFAIGLSSQSPYAAFDPNTGLFSYLIGPFAGQQGFSQHNYTPDVDLKGATPIFAGAFAAGSVAMFLKDVSGKYHVYVSPIYSNPIDDHFSFESADLDKAKYFTFCDNTSIMYAASDDTIWAVLLNGVSATVRKVTWSPDSSEEIITGIQHYKQAWYGTRQFSSAIDYGYALPTHQLQIIITTYNPSTKEGKIYLRPFNVASGLFTMKNNGTYGGFGEILCISPTFR